MSTSSDVERLRKKFQKQNNDIIRANALYATQLRKLDHQRIDLNKQIFELQQQVVAQQVAADVLSESHAQRSDVSLRATQAITQVTINLMKSVSENLNNNMSLINDTLKLYQEFTDYTSLSTPPPPPPPISNDSPIEQNQSLKHTEVEKKLNFFQKSLDIIDTASPLSKVLKDGCDVVDGIAARNKDKYSRRSLLPLGEDRRQPLVPMENTLLDTLKWKDKQDDQQSVVDAEKENFASSDAGKVSSPTDGRVTPTEGRVTRPKTPKTPSAPSLKRYTHPNFILFTKILETFTSKSRKENPPSILNFPLATNVLPAAPTTTERVIPKLGRPRQPLSGFQAAAQQSTLQPRQKNKYANLNSDENLD
ncbi:hypothetical protein HK098_003626 [Nowakowskiella sp. JEL0407]|nr:hypothetical protein HK098_003626 [Nowakowskiella sp. JEL0407]